MKLATIFALVLGSATAMACPAQADAMDDDVGCLVAVMMMPMLNKQSHQMDDKFIESTSFVGTVYFMGKVAGRDPQYDVEKALVDKLAQMNGETIRSTLVRCGGELQNQGKRWEAIGKHLIERGQEMQKEKGQL